MKIVVRIFCVIMALVGFSLAQTSGPGTIQINTIYAGADGKFEAQPDTALVHMNVAAQQDSSHDAYEHAATAAQRVRDVLKANGIDVKSAQVGFYQVQPVYDWKNPKRKVIAYRVTTDITLKLRDFTKIGPITEQLADIEDTQNQSVNYTLEDIELAKSKASEDAVKKARNQANAVATASGRTLGDLLYASIDVNQQFAVPMAITMRARSAVAGAAVTPAPTEEFTPQTVTINAHVNALFGLK
ncbi:MAG TPA: SIMPL domain-containing protein [Candidatus Angelobacter sp.]|nr:SIMPL domain-containing protein [Candidatus Angelobacter sp.]